MTRLQEVALSLVGKHYVLHSSNPAVGFDCGTFVRHCLYQAGVDTEINIPLVRPDFGLHKKSTLYTDIMDAYFTRIKDPLKADLICLKYGRSYNHAGVVLPENKYVHCALAGGVRIDTIPTDHEAIFYKVM